MVPCYFNQLHLFMKNHPQNQKLNILLLSFNQLHLSGSLPLQDQKPNLNPFTYNQLPLCGIPLLHLFKLVVVLELLVLEVCTYLPVRLSLPRCLFWFPIRLFHFPFLLLPSPSSIFSFFSLLAFFGKKTCFFFVFRFFTIYIICPPGHHLNSPSPHLFLSLHRDIFFGHQTFSF